jgi:hypothetical protein
MANEEFGTIGGGRNLSPGREFGPRQWRPRPISYDEQMARRKATKAKQAKARAKSKRARKARRRQQ